MPSNLNFYLKKLPFVARLSAAVGESCFLFIYSITQVQQFFNCKFWKRICVFYVKVARLCKTGIVCCAGVRLTITACGDFNFAYAKKDKRAARYKIFCIGF